MNMDFGNALRALQGMEKVTRQGWDGRFLMIAADDAGPHILVSTDVDGQYEVWTPTQPDVLATDWMIV